MPNDEIHQPHDKLFKAGFSVPANTAAFLSAHLPAQLTQRISWPDLQLEPGSFIDEAFQHCESDLLFSTTLSGSDCLIYLLFEHQRTKDPWIGLRLNRYQQGIWQHYRAENPKATHLPIILPVVIAQNATRWDLDPQFSSLFDIPATSAEELAPWIPQWSFRLIQLAELPFDKILGTPAGIMVLRTLKAEQTRQLLEQPVWDEALLTQVPARLIETLLTYIFSAGSVDKDAFITKLEEIKQAELKQSAMTLAQQFRQEGHQKGHQEGRQEGRQAGEFAVVHHLLTRKFPGIAEQIKPQIAQMDEERLLAFSEALLFLTSEQDCIN